MTDILYSLPIDPDVPPAPAEVVNSLVVADLPAGLSRVFVELVGDGLATGIRVPVLVARGVSPGPTVGITASIHGNELNGIPVIHDVFRTLDLATLRGNVVGVVALNVPGIHLHQREFIDGTDLNRIMPGDARGNVAQVYAHRILERIVSQFQYLVDLHTASFGRINSLYVRADMTHPVAAAMAYLQDPQIIVHSAITTSTLRGAAMRMGIPGITVEIGDPQRWQRKLTRAASRGVLDVLELLGVAPAGSADLPAANAAPASVAAAAGLDGDPVLCSSSAWMYTDRGGLLEVFPELTDVVEAGQRVARVRNAFGDVIREYEAGDTGIVVGRSTNPVGQTGARIVHLGRLARPTDGLFGRSQCLAAARAQLGG